MSVEQNKVIARRVFEDIWNQGRLDVVDELFDANFITFLSSSPHRKKTSRSTLDMIVSPSGVLHEVFTLGEQPLRFRR